jgi:hypothetical protein
VNSRALSRRTPLSLALAASTLAAAAVAAFATPSGLNNIPTADVVPEGVLVVQGFAEFGRDRGPTWFAGIKYGPAQGWEVGLDDTAAGAGSPGGPTLQAKCRWELKEGAALALGAANISDDRERHGDVFPYAVLSAPLGALRGHLGYGWQADNRAWFVGADAPVSRALTLRADWTQVADGEESVGSLGFIAAVGPRLLAEAWASFPTAEGAGTSYLVKLDWVVPLSRS